MRPWRGRATATSERRQRRRSRRPGVRRRQGRPMRRLAPENALCFALRRAPVRPRLQGYARRRQAPCEHRRTSTVITGSATCHPKSPHVAASTSPIPQDRQCCPPSPTRWRSCGVTMQRRPANASPWEDENSGQAQGRGAKQGGAKIIDTLRKQC